MLMPGRGNRAFIASITSQWPPASWVCHRTPMGKVEKLWLMAATMKMVLSVA